MLSITGDMEFAELLEKMAYNALPAQASDDFLTRQYFQAANQVQLTDQMEASYQTIGHQGTDYVFGTLSGYPCCTCNMHQSWPKFVQNLWYATSDGGAAALVYAPSIVEMKVGQGVQVRIIEETLYPFRDEVIFHFELHQESDFPFHLRIPAWTEDANISVNGEAWNGSMEGNIAKINRTWRNGDSVRLKIPMVIKISQWFDFTKTIERGPLVYSLKIGEEFRYKDRGDRYRGFYEVFPKSDWNYALFHADVEEPINSFVVEEMKWNGSYPWNLENVPVTIKARGIRLPEWKLSPGGLPAFPAWWGPREMAPEESIFSEITLVPYGCTTLRITEFPVYGLN
jgi:hypothetical protein